MHAKPQQRKRNVLQKRLENRGINGKMARNPKQLLFLFSEDEREPYIMLQQQVTVPAETQCLTSSGSTLTIKAIQRNSSMTLRKQYMQATV